MIRIIEYILQWAIITLIIHFVTTGFLIAVVKLNFDADLRKETNGVSFFVRTFKKSIAWPDRVRKTSYFKSYLSLVTFKTVWCVKRNALGLGFILLLILNII